MALITHPRAVVTAVGRVAGWAVRRLLSTDEHDDARFGPVPDDLPRDSLFAQPLVVDTTVVGDGERLSQDEQRATFRVLVRDADGRRCPDIHVEARASGPHRSATGEATTDMLGGARFRMSGPPGDYRLEVLEVAALGLEWDRAASTTEAAVTLA